MNQTKYFAIEYKPEGKGIPYYAEMVWSPDLPDFHSPSATPSGEAFSSEYYVKIKTRKYEADLDLDALLAPELILSICRSLSVNFFYRPANVTLYGGAPPSSKLSVFSAITTGTTEQRTLNI